MTDDGTCATAGSSVTLLTLYYIGAKIGQTVLATNQARKQTGAAYRLSRFIVARRPSLLRWVVRLVIRYSILEIHMSMKRKFLPLQALLWAGVVLAMMFPVLGFYGPRPGAPLDRRSLGISEFWLIRIVETATPTGASWVMETNWLNLVLCSIVGGFAIVWIRTSHSGSAEQSGDGERPMKRVLRS